MLSPAITGTEYKQEIPGHMKAFLTLNGKQSGTHTGEKIVTVDSVLLAS